MESSKEQWIKRGKRALNLEAEAIRKTAEGLDDGFYQILEKMTSVLSNQRKLIFTGVGKNVPICTKLTGTFNSTGVPTAFLDPNQALHGDLGLCAEGDLCFLISNSGETEDLLRILPFLARLKVQTVAITADPASSLAGSCDHQLSYQYDRESCPHNLAPTASTTAALALGDALAMVFLEMRGFSRDDFARFHPAGSLGQSLLLEVNEFMRTGSRFACELASISVQQALLAITRARCGSIALTSEDGKLAGVFSDGDFRRAALENPSVLQAPVADYMTREPRTIAADALAVEALRMFEELAVDDLVALNAEGRPVGLVDSQDMPKIRLV